MPGFEPWSLHGTKYEADGLPMGHCASLLRSKFKQHIKPNGKESTKRVFPGFKSFSELLYLDWIKNPVTYNVTSNECITGNGSENGLRHDRGSICPSDMDTGKKWYKWVCKRMIQRFSIFRI